MEDVVTTLIIMIFVGLLIYKAIEFVLNFISME